jgi:hypothetical protein
MREDEGLIQRRERRFERVQIRRMVAHEDDASGLV